MPQTLLIVESPKKARTIAGVLGAGHRVEASFGHVRDLPPRELGVDLAHGFEPTYVLVPKARERLARLRTAAQAAGRVLLATDPDREGEAIAWHLATALGLRPGSFARIAFHEITARAVRAALAQPRGLDLALVEAQQARRVLDRLVGYQVSPLLWRKVQRGTSAGRVQSVALRLVVEREREIAAFVPQESWRIAVTLAPAERPTERFQAGLVEHDGRPPDLRTRADAEAVAGWLRDPATRYGVGATERQPRERPAPPPFTTSTLQQAAANRLRLGAKRTMALAQSLYEAGAITYHRTDSVQVAPEAVEAVRRLIAERFGPEHLPAQPRRHVTRQKSAQEAHEAVRPTDPARLAASLAGDVAADERRLYELIWQRFVASQMAAARYLVDTAAVEAVHPAHRARLTARATTLLFAGWLAVYGVEEGDEAAGGDPSAAGDLPANRALPTLRPGDALACLGVEATQHFSQPPPRYTEASLVRALEALGVGRPSTYATILATLEERGYATLAAPRGQRRVFTPTPLGFAANDFLCRHFATVVDPAFTARLEEGLDDVARGAVGWRDLLAGFYTPFAASLAAAGAAEPVALPAAASGAPGPAAGSPAPAKPGRKRASRAASPLPAGGAAPRPAASRGGRRASRPAPEPTGGTCPRCGRPLVRRTQRSTGLAFQGCSGYPACRYTAPLPPDGLTGERTG